MPKRRRTFEHLPVFLGLNIVNSSTYWGKVPNFPITRQMLNFTFLGPISIAIHSRSKEKIRRHCLIKSTCATLSDRFSIRWLKKTQNYRSFHTFILLLHCFLLHYSSRAALFSFLGGCEDPKIGVKNSNVQLFSWKFSNDTFVFQNSWINFVTKSI